MKEEVCVFDHACLDKVEEKETTGNKSASVVGYVAVQLTPYEWHETMRELEHLLRIANRDNSTVKRLYTKIATQLHGDKVTVEIAT